MRTFKSLLMTFSGENNQDIKSDWKDAMSDYGLEYSKRLCDNYFFKYGKSYIEAVFEEVANNIEYIYIHQVNGQICEFGTGYGVSANIISSLNGKFSQIINFSVKDLYLFDSFEGLPPILNDYDKLTHWVEGQYKGLSAEEIKNMCSANMEFGAVHVITGWYKNTLIDFSEKISLLHIDCDLYESTHTVLDHIFKKGLLEVGSVIMFDDFNCNRSSDDLGERKAFFELAKEYNLKFEKLREYSSSGVSFRYHGLDRIR